MIVLLTDIDSGNDSGDDVTQEDGEQFKQQILHRLESLTKAAEDRYVCVCV